MITNVHQMEVLLPWAQAWVQMQWEIAFWVAEQGDRARIQVVWNEERLSAEVDVAEFQATTTPFYKALQQRLADGCQWQFKKQEGSTGHRLVLGLSASQGA